MNIRILKYLFLLVVGVCYTHADSPAVPYPHITASTYGQYYFVMLPGPEYDEGRGVAYELMSDGSTKELWRTEGWYAFRLFLSNDGRYLVRMGPWNMGFEPSPRDLAVAFYENGKLLRQYSTAHLVKDKAKVSRSVSHYTWLSEDTGVTFHLTLDSNNKFGLKTIDGIVYVFDATTGKVAEQRKNVRP